MIYPNIKEEQILREIGYSYVAGIDEAGRGAWAGPVVAAAVILRPLNEIDSFGVFKDLKDSKLLSKKKRDKLFDIVSKKSFKIGVGIIDREIIDREGILVATKRAVLKGIEIVQEKLDFALIDAINFESFPVGYKAIIKGDKKVLSIAAASVIAKVTRDRILENFGKKYPGYGFENHKGYGTKEHQQAIDELGVCELHRKSYAPIQRILRQGSEMI